MKINILYGIIVLLLMIITSLLFSDKGTGLAEEKSYKKGIETGFDLIMKQAGNKNCDTIDIKRDSEEVRLINVKCLSNEGIQ